MAYPNEFIKVDIIGDCFNQTEIWNTGLKLQRTAPLGSITEETLKVAAERVEEAWREFFTSGNPAPASNFRTLEVKAAHIGTDGRYVGDAYTHFIDEPYSGSGYIGTTESPLPQAAVVATLSSQKQRGPASKGRMYLPGIAYDINQFGLMPLAMTTSLSERFNIFIRAINDGGSFLDHPMEVILNSPVGQGEERPVNKTGVDQKVDTQRRRANAITSDYVIFEV